MRFSPHTAVVEYGKQNIIRRQEAGDRPSVRPQCLRRAAFDLFTLVRFGAKQTSGGKKKRCLGHSLPAGKFTLGTGKKEKYSAKTDQESRDGERSDSQRWLNSLLPPPPHGGKSLWREEYEREGLNPGRVQRRRRTPVESSDFQTKKLQHAEGGEWTSTDSKQDRPSPLFRAGFV